MMATLIKNGTLVTAEVTFPADILVEGELIVEVGKNLPSDAGEVVDASGKLIFPGGVDPHVHLDLPMFGTVSSDDHYTGTKAAAFGGTTTVIDFIPFDFPSLDESVEKWHQKAKKAAVDYAAHMNLSGFNASIAAEIPSLREKGITTLKIFTAYNGRLRIDDDSILQALTIARENGMLVMLHAEDGDEIETLTAQVLAAGHTDPIWHARTRPAPGAVAAAERLFTLAASVDAALYLVHMTSAGEVDLLSTWRKRGSRVMGETCPQYLLFSEDELSGPEASKWICSPPLRTAADNDRLWEGLGDGTIQTIGTDHCPFFYDGTKPILYEGKKVAIPGKELGAGDFTRIPNGLPGVEDRLPVLWTSGVGSGRMTANRFVALTSTNPAKIFGLYPRKGALLPGSDADIVIWDPGKKVKYGIAHSHQRTDYNLYEGWDLTGMPEKVFLRGQCIVDGGNWLGKAGMGQFLLRRPGEIL